MISRAVVRTGTQLAFLCALLVVTELSAQTGSSDLAAALRLQVLSKKFILRNFSAEPIVHASATVSGLALTDTHLKSFSVVTITDVNSATHHVLLKGTKQYLLHDGPASWGYEGSAEPLVVDILLDESKDGVTAAGIVDQLFYRSLSTALSALNPELARSIPGYFQFPPHRPKHPTCDCGQHGAANCLTRSSEEGYRHPELIHHEDIGLPQGDPPGSSWVSESLLQVKDTGEVGDIWITKATNAASEETAIKADQSYRFRPATCHGTPITTYMYVDASYARP